MPSFRERWLGARRPVDQDLSAIAKNELKKNLQCRNIRPITFILHIKVDMVHAITFLSIYNLYFPQSM